MCIIYFCHQSIFPTRILHDYWSWYCLLKYFRKEWRCSPYILSVSVTCLIPPFLSPSLIAALPHWDMDTFHLQLCSVRPLVKIHVWPVVILHMSVSVSLSWCAVEALLRALLGVTHLDVKLCLLHFVLVLYPWALSGSVYVCGGWFVVLGS